MFSKYNNFILKKILPVFLVSSLCAQVSYAKDYLINMSDKLNFQIYELKKDDLQNYSDDRLLIYDSNTAKDLIEIANSENIFKNQNNLYNSKIVALFNLFKCSLESRGIDSALSSLENYLANYDAQINESGIDYLVKVNFNYSFNSEFSYDIAEYKIKLELSNTCSDYFSASLLSIKPFFCFYDLDASKTYSSYGNFSEIIENPINYSNFPITDYEYESFKFRYFKSIYLFLERFIKKIDLSEIYSLIDDSDKKSRGFEIQNKNFGVLINKYKASDIKYDSDCSNSFLEINDVAYGYHLKFSFDLKNNELIDFNYSNPVGINIFYKKLFFGDNYKKIKLSDF